jgi:anthranilate 1,2-dioxygenase small subunit
MSEISTILDVTPGSNEPATLYERVTRFYADYTHTVAGGDLKLWPDFFTDDCLYQATSRENHEQNLPLGLLQCDGRKMIEDRAAAIMNTQVFQPRRIRYYISGLRIVSSEAATIDVCADFLVVQALLNSTPVVVSFGEYLDEIVIRDGRMLFRKKICIYDNDVVTTSLVYPL